MFDATLIFPNQEWALWTVLFLVAAFGFWAESGIRWLYPQFFAARLVMPLPLSSELVWDIGLNKSIKF